MLKVQNVCKTFNAGTINEKRALVNVDLHLAPGDFVTVIGGNGAGKSTLMNMIAGVYPIDSPGGWQLIGLTPVRMYDPDRAEPILPKAGEYIKFYSITKAEFDEIAAQEAAGTYVCKRHPRKEGAK